MARANAATKEVDSARAYKCYQAFASCRETWSRQRRFITPQEAQDLLSALPGAPPEAQALRSAPPDAPQEAQALQSAPPKVEQQGSVTLDTLDTRLMSELEMSRDEGTTESTTGQEAMLSPAEQCAETLPARRHEDHERTSSSKHSSSEALQQMCDASLGNVQLWAFTVLALLGYLFTPGADLVFCYSFICSIVHVLYVAFRGGLMHAHPEVVQASASALRLIGPMIVRLVAVCAYSDGVFLEWWDGWQERTLPYARAAWALGGMLSVRTRTTTTVWAVFLLIGVATGAIISLRAGSVRGLTLFFGSSCCLAPASWAMAHALVERLVRPLVTHIELLREQNETQRAVIEAHWSCCHGDVSDDGELIARALKCGGLLHQ